MEAEGEVITGSIQNFYNRTSITEVITVWLAQCAFLLFTYHWGQKNSLSALVCLDYSLLRET